MALSQLAPHLSENREEEIKKERDERPRVGGARLEMKVLV
jgi:hypothetical protein